MTFTRRNGNVTHSFTNLSDEFFNKDLFDWNNSNFSDTSTTLPAVNVKETPESFLVKMAAPGMKKEDFKVELNNNMPTISSKQKSEREEKENDKYARKEFSYQSFQRSFRLSREAADADNTQVKYENGILQLTISKREEVKQKPSRLINIS